MPERQAFHTTLAYLLARYEAVGRRLGLRADRVEALEAWQHELRAELRRITGLDTMRPAPLRPRVTERLGLEGYIRERVEIQTEPGIVMPLYVLLPLEMAPGERRPAVLAPHGHGSGGKYAPAGRRDIPLVEATIDVLVHGVFEGEHRWHGVGAIPFLERLLA